MMKHERIRTFLLLFGLLSLAGCAAQSAYRHGQDAAKRGDVDRAVAYYMQALHENGGQPSVPCLL